MERIVVRNLGNFQLLFIFPWEVSQFFEIRSNKGQIRIYFDVSRDIYSYICILREDSFTHSFFAEKFVLLRITRVE